MKKYTTTEYNTTEDNTTDHDNVYSTKYEYMTANYNRTEHTTTNFHYNYSTTEETMAKKDVAIENETIGLRQVQWHKCFFPQSEYLYITSSFQAIH